MWSVGTLPGGNSRGIWSGWPVMLLSVGERVCHSDVKMQLESHEFFAENNGAANKCYALQPLQCIFQSYAVLHRPQGHSLDVALRLIMPHCPQTIPGSLLDPNFSSVWPRHWALLFFPFLSFCSSDRERRVIRSHREVTQLCFPL